MKKLPWVWSPRLPKIGSPWALEVFSRPGYATSVQSAVVCFAAAPASVPLGPWGTLGLDPGSLVALPVASLPAPAGKHTLGFTIPNAPALVGATFFVQALVLPTVNLAEARFTNVLAETVMR